jgi:hypothetical protein
MKKLLITGCIAMFLMSSCVTENTSLFFQNNTGYLRKKNDHIEFRYTTKVFFTRDKEKFVPINFEIQLPKGLKYCEFINSRDFVFYYKANQVIAITTTYIDVNMLKTHLSIRQQDSIYIPQENQIKLIINDIGPSKDKKWDVTNIKMITNRQNMIRYKRGVSILLFNIKKENFQNYKEIVQSIEIL